MKTYKKLPIETIILLAFGSIVVIFLAVFLVYLNTLPKNISPSLNPDTSNANIKNDSVNASPTGAVLVLDFGDKERWFTGEVFDGMTVNDALAAASLSGKFSYQAGSQIYSVDGYKDTGKNQWRCISGNQTVDDLTQKSIRPGEKIICRYVIQQ